MPIKIVNIYITTFLIFFCSTSILSQTQNFIIKKYSNENGLPDNRVNDIVQDSTGRIWIATKTGIAVYDGAEWRKFTEQDSVPQIEYIRIKIDKKGVIWFLPRSWDNNFLVYYKNNKFEKFSTIENTYNKRIAFSSFDIQYIDNKPEICISTLTKGLIRFAKNNWSTKTRNNGILSDTLTQVFYRNKDLFISSIKGLTEITAKGHIINYDFQSQVNDSKILAMVEVPSTSNSDGKIILLSQKWLAEFDAGKFNILTRNFNIPFSGIEELNAINFNSTGDIIFSNPARVFYYDSKTNSTNQFLLEAPSSNRGANSIFIDYEHNLWFASLRGLYKCRGIPFRNYSKAEGLLEDEVTAISEFNSRALVFGHNYGISIKTSKGFKYIETSNTKYDGRNTRILDIYHDKKMDKIFLTAYAYSLAILTPDFNISWLPNPNKFRNFSIIASKNDLFVSSNHGLLRLRDHNLKEINPNIAAFIRKGIFINDTIAYLATNTNVIKWINSTFYKISNTQKDYIDLYSIFYNDKFGLLVGGIRGLYTVRNDSLFTFRFNEQEINESIYFIIEDKNHNIWLGTNHGVLRWDGKKLLRFTKNDGLAGNETNRAAGFIDSKGNVWIGTDEGVSMFIGNEIDYSSIKPKIAILNIEDSENQKYNIRSNIEFAPDYNNLTFHYRGLSFIDEFRNVYQVKLSKINDDWADQFVTNYSYAKFNNLPPGDYLFSVRVKNAKGIWSDWVSTANISIDNYFYFKPYFIISSFILLFVVLFYVYDYLQQKRYTKKLESAVESRTDELRKKQSELITSMERYKGIVDSQTELVVRMSSDGRLTFVNDAFCDTFGKSRTEILGGLFLNFIFPDDISIIIEERKNLEKHPFRTKLELRANTVNGIRWFSWEDYALLDSNHKIIEVQGVGRDITIQKEIESELEKRVRERTIELKSLISQSPLGIIMFGQDGYLIEFNDSANNIFGDLNKHLPPNKSFNIFEDEFLIKNNYQDRLKNLQFSNSQLVTNKIYIDNPDNEVYKNLYSNFLVYRFYNVDYENEQTMIVLLIENITELHKSEESNKKLAEEKLKITTIINTIEAERDRISKELHDGVGQIITIAKLKLDILNIKTTETAPEIEESIKLMLNAGDEIRRIIKDLKPSDVEKFGLISAIEMICTRINQIENINMHCYFEEDINLPSKTEEVIIYRIIQEALNNIIKHSKCSNAGIRMKRDDNFLLVEIWDDGVGINNNVEKKKSLGFGIMNMKGRAESIGAEIKFSPSEPKGTVIRIKIPIK